MEPTPPPLNASRGDSLLRPPHHLRHEPLPLPRVETEVRTLASASPFTASSPLLPLVALPRRADRHRLSSA
jgi:hypothetical protein